MAYSSHRGFVDWEERFVSNERGCRVVHYYLKDRAGQQWLAVVGTERSLRHMVYVVCDESLLAAGLDKTTTSGCKWRARREVVDWLSSLLIRTRGSDPNHFAGSPRNALYSSTDVDSSYSHEAEEIESGQEESQSRHHHAIDQRKHISGPNSDVVWVGPEWICRKKLKHFHAFQRNGIVISVQRFVYVMTEEKERHIAHVEDLYEDKKQRRKLRVRWFHKPSELGCKILPLAPDQREVFYTTYEQDLSVECVDGLAIVLTPEHFHLCQEQLGFAFMEDIHMCSRQFVNEGIRPFNLQSLKGYSQQPVLGYIGLDNQNTFTRQSHATAVMEVDEEDGAEIGKAIRRGPRSCRRSSRRRTGITNRRISCTYTGKVTSASQWTSVQRSGDATTPRLGDATASTSGSAEWKDSSSSGGFSEGGSFDLAIRSYQIGDHIEVLSEDSGIRGCWFKGTVVGVSHRRLKVRYDDLKDDEDKENLEEWIVSNKMAKPCGFGIRFTGRSTIRPTSESTSIPLKLEVNMVVDAWRGDGWWEGVIRRIDDDAVQVWFPGELETSSCKHEELRPSREWMNGIWKPITPHKASLAEEVSIGRPQVGYEAEPEARAEDNRRPNTAVSCISTVLTVPQAATTRNDSSRKGTGNEANLKVGTCCQQEGTSFSKPRERTSRSEPSLSNDKGERTSKASTAEEPRVLSARATCDNKTAATLRSDAVEAMQVEVTDPVATPEGSGHLELVKRECLDNGSSPDSSRWSEGANSDKLTSTGLKWKWKRHRQGDAFSHRRTSHATTERKERVLEKGRGNPATRRGHDSKSQGSVEKLRTSKSDESEDIRMPKKHRQGNDGRVKSIHGTSIGSSLFTGFMPMANMVMSR